VAGRGAARRNEKYVPSGPAGDGGGNGDTKKIKETVKIRPRPVVPSNIRPNNRLKHRNKCFPSCIIHNDEL